MSEKGSSGEYLKKNNTISDVNQSLHNIEKIIGKLLTKCVYLCFVLIIILLLFHLTKLNLSLLLLANGPENWWVGQSKGEGENEGKVTFEEEEEEDEEVDFQKRMDQKYENKRKREEYSSDDDDDEEDDDKKDPHHIDKKSGLPEFSCSPIDMQSSQLDGGGDDGRKTMSIDQSLFSEVDGRKTSATVDPKFSCGSTIAMQSSQPETQQTATASQLDRVLAPSAQKNDMKSPPPVISEKVGVSSSKPMSILTPPDRKTLSPKRRATRVSFQQQPRVMLLDPSWKLSNEHTRNLRTCGDFLSMLKMPSDDFESDEFDSGFDFDTEEGRESFLAMLSSNKTDNLPPAPLSFYAVSTEKLQDYDGLQGKRSTVARSFTYYLAVACGLPIVDIEFLSSAANMKRRGTTSHQRYPFPFIPGPDDDKNKLEPCLVLGAVGHGWGSIEKAHLAALDRHSLWQKEEGPHAQSETLLPGTDLLHGYTVLLLGEYDQPNHSKRTVAKRRKERNSEAKQGGGYCTRGNISLLLLLCGANVYDVDSVAASKHIKKGLTENELANIKKSMPLGAHESSSSLNDALQYCAEEGSKCIVMVKEKSDAKLGIEFLNQLVKDKASQIPVVACQWVLDTIGDFEVGA